MGETPQQQHLFPYKRLDYARAVHMKMQATKEDCGESQCERLPNCLKYTDACDCMKIVTSSEF